MELRTGAGFGSLTVASMGVARRPTASAQRVVAVDDSPPFQRRSAPLLATVPRRGVVLLVDDQPIIGEAVRRMLAGADSLDFHYCREPASALTRAAEISPTVVLLDLVMPDVDGLEVLRRMRADERFQDLPIIVLSTKEEPAVKAEAFALGANDYLVKLPDRIELVARVRHHSRGYVALLERNLAFAELRVSREMLANDLASAARYVRSLLPPPGEMAGIRAEWRFIPSADLGGDAFGYHRLDDDQVAIYLLDVCGHGVGAALLSVSALNAIRGEALPNTDFRDPAAVLAALNRAFPMERHNDMFFTVWYGVHDRRRRRLRWAGGGHPAALLVQPTPGSGSAARPAGMAVIPLDSDNPLLGAIDGLEFSAREIDIPAEASLWIFSDGAFEIPHPDGSMGSPQAFRDLIISQTRPGEAALDAVMASIKSLAGGDDLLDDVSILVIDFGN